MKPLCDSMNWHSLTHKGAALWACTPPPPVASTAPPVGLHASSNPWQARELLLVAFIWQWG